ncbi:chaperone [Lithospermum erythrorhizon]|uniref:Chaperone n=1 Tax=Lithospermum erythrorhizon TaxID=34254 RepID=A0AAV3QHS0_LITER
MEISSSSSSPLSVHSWTYFTPHPHPRLSLQRCRNQLPIFQICPSTSSISPLSTTTLSNFFGTSLSRKYSQKIIQSESKRPLYIVSGIFERFTERAIKAVMFAQREAKILGKNEVFTEHLLLGLIAEESGAKGYLGSGITIDEAREAVKSIWKVDNQFGTGGEGMGSASDIAFSASVKRVFEAAVDYSRTMGYNFIGPEHIAVGLFSVDDGNAGRVLKRLGVKINYLAVEAVNRLQGELTKDGRDTPAAFKRSREKAFEQKITRQQTSEKSGEKKALDEFCVDLTARARDGLIDPVIGRTTEIQRMIQILCRRTKNNPILLGEAGVGKTAIAEGLAIHITEGTAPAFLLNKRVMSLDIGLLISGSKERGELESRLTTLIKEIKNSGNVILFIDEVHVLIGSGTIGHGKGSGLDVANILKPPLGRGELQCIASTTLDEYRAYFETDKAFARRFQPVLINEPSQEEAVKILLGLRERYEAHHRCIYTLEALHAAVNLSARYIPDRYLPDKAIDLIDEAGSRARMEEFKRKKEQQTSILSMSPSDYWQKIRAVQATHDSVQAGELKESGNELDKSDAGELNLGPFLPSSPEDDASVMVGPEEIAAVASLWSGIPVQQLTADEAMNLVGLDEQLKKRVVGQDEAVAAISRAVKRSRVGLNDPDRPIAAMLFCGPTGVGKTELTKALAASYFGSESSMIRLDMSEYMERHTVSKLIGSPPGYVGYGEGGILTEAIRKRPFTVILLDEIEKAHPDIFNILLQLFEDGHLTDSQGRRVSFKNALIVMTSNIGSSAIAKGRHNSIGFLLADDDSTTTYAGMKALVMEELKTYFRPELLNRIDEVVVFRSLEKPQMLEILNVMMSEVKERLISLGIGLEVSEAIMEHICEQGYDRSYGARPLRRAVTQIIEDLLSESLLTGDFKPGDVAVIHLDESGNPIVTNQSSQNIQISDRSVMGS